MMTENEDRENIGEQSSQGKEHYDLYTEHIVTDPWPKIKRWIKKSFVLLAIAIVFGVIAGLVMLLVYSVGTNRIHGVLPTQPTSESISEPTRPPVESTSPLDTQQETTREDITLNVEDSTTIETEAETETDPSPDEEETVNPAIAELEEEHKVLKQVVAMVNRSMVTVSVAKENVDWFASTYQDITQEFGLVIANNEAGCYIITDYELVRGASSVIDVRFASGKTLQGTLIAGDKTTGLAVILTQTITEEDAIVAELGGAGSISQGDFAIAVGKIYGFAGGMGYGIATATANTVYDTDACFQLVNTNIAGTANSAGVIANLKGEVVGIITTSYNSGNNSLISAYSVTGIKTLIENLSNSHMTAYLGIRGQNISREIAETYKLPDGVYVAVVEAGSPAYKAGLQSGDVLTKINGRAVGSMNDFMDILSHSNVGDTVTVVIERRGRENYKPIEYSVVLGVE